MRKRQESIATQYRVDNFKENFKRPRFSLPQYQACVSGFVEIDLDHHHEGVVKMLREIYEIIFTIKVLRDAKEGEERTPIDSLESKLQLLRDLEDEFRWQLHYGIRPYEAMW